MRRATSVALFVLITSSPALSGASFQGLGKLPGCTYSFAYDISVDGTTVVGYSQSATGDQAFRWRDGVMTGLGFLPGTSGGSQAYSVSANGSVVVGNSGYSGFRWASGTMTSIGDLPGGPDYSGPTAISADGSIIVGASDSTAGREAFRWRNGVMTSLGDLPGGSIDSVAWGVSADGSVVVGVGATASANSAFRWQNGTMTRLAGDLAGDTRASEASAVSADGQVIVGGYTDQSGHGKAFRWQAGTMIDLGDLPGGYVSGHAYSVSADGSVVVGDSYSIAGQEAFLWDCVHGMRSLRDVLTNEFKLSLSGWQLTQARGVSDDGLSIVGFGKNPAGQFEGWIARLPEPGMLTLLAVGAAMLTRQRRGRRASFIRV